jgi:Domain of unknown function (DUF5916)
VCRSHRASAGLYWAWVRIAVFAGILCPLSSLSWAGSQGTAWATTPGERLGSARASKAEPSETTFPGENDGPSGAARPVSPDGALARGEGWRGQEKGPSSQLEPPAIVIPRLVKGPTIDEFLNMKPEGEIARRMTRVSGFVQRDPHDGAPVTQKTEAYLGYDSKNLYVVFICFDEPGKVRGRKGRREDISDDDTVEVMLDTFHDRRRAYAFQINPLGVQWDAIWTEAPHEETSGNFDTSFDTVWYSQGKITPQGYVAWLAIPFKSLRFSPAEEQTWGILLYRGIVRENEDTFWPQVSHKVEGRLGQAATLTGMTGISPGRNIQLIPYGILNSFRDIDARDPNALHFENRAIGGTAGIDGKVILNDRSVIDLTANPDFSQVESDEPQVTVNQRYRVYFPEKRPFFIENADYFRTPLDLFFTRNIVNPSYGARFTGKLGDYSVGLLTADDKSPGLAEPAWDPLGGSKQYFNIARVSRDIFKQSSVGVIFADQEYGAAHEFNRVGGADARLKFSPAWTSTLQSVVSSSDVGFGYQAGPASYADVTYAGANADYQAIFKDISPGFTSVPGFINRVDIRDVSNQFDYRFRPKTGALVAWGPSMHTDWVWGHDGTRLDLLTDPSVGLRFKGQTYLTVFPYTDFHERLRPSDYPALATNKDFHEHDSSVVLGTSLLKWMTAQGYYIWGDDVNFVPPVGQFAVRCPGWPGLSATSCPPFLARSDGASAGVSLHPVSSLKIDNTYLFSRLRDRESSMAIFNNHIIRTKWNWQFTRELSFRMILQYTATLANPAFTSLQSTKQFNADFLLTYLVHPGTAIYVGYNSDHQNINSPLQVDPFGRLARNPEQFLQDGRLFFVKVSYLYRF